MNHYPVNFGKDFVPQRHIDDDCIVVDDDLVNSFGHSFDSQVRGFDVDLSD